MYQTIQLSSCVSVQGEFVELLESGEVVIRDGNSVYRGHPIARDRRMIDLPASIRNALRSAGI